MSASFLISASTTERRGPAAAAGGPRWQRAASALAKWPRSVGSAAPAGRAGPLASGAGGSGNPASAVLLLSSAGVLGFELVASRPAETLALSSRVGRCPRYPVCNVLGRDVEAPIVVTYAFACTLSTSEDGRRDRKRHAELRSGGRATYQGGSVRKPRPRGDGHSRIVSALRDSIDVTESARGVTVAVMCVDSRYEGMLKGVGVSVGPRSPWG